MGGNCSASTDPCKAMLDAVECVFHARRSEWLFLRELRVGTGRRNNNLQRVDAFALNCFPHTGMKRICYEVKASRADFLTELRNPLKRRIGMRYSNEFYFVMPAGLVDIGEIPADCGLIETGRATAEQWRVLLKRHAGFFHHDPDCRVYCIITAPAPWRESPGPTWQLVAAMMRHQRRQMEEAPPAPPEQTRFAFV